MVRGSHGTLEAVHFYADIGRFTGCSIANSYISIGSGRLKYANQIWFEGGFGILSSGFFTYDPLIW